MFAVLAVSFAGLASAQFLPKNGVRALELKRRSNVYIVRMADLPVVAYDGHIRALLRRSLRRTRRSIRQIPS